jgi:hypothetical protein
MSVHHIFTQSDVVFGDSLNLNQCWGSGGHTYDGFGADLEALASRLEKRALASKCSHQALGLHLCGWEQRNALQE